MEKDMAIRWWNAYAGEPNCPRRRWTTKTDPYRWTARLDRLGPVYVCWPYFALQLLLPHLVHRSCTTRWVVGVDCKESTDQLLHHWRRRRSILPRWVLEVQCLLVSFLLNVNVIRRMHVDPIFRPLFVVVSFVYLAEGRRRLTFETFDETRCRHLPFRFHLPLSCMMLTLSHWGWWCWIDHHHHHHCCWSRNYYYYYVISNPVCPFGPLTDDAKNVHLHHHHNRIRSPRVGSISVCQLNWTHSTMDWRKVTNHVDHEGDDFRWHQSYLRPCHKTFVVVERARSVSMVPILRFGINWFNICQFK